MDPIRLADRYFANMRERNLESLTALFAANATLTLPDGRVFAGIDAIRQMFTGLFAAQSPSPNPIAVIVGANGIATEIETRLPDGTTRRTANFFHLDGDGSIERLSVYARAG